MKIKIFLYKFITFEGLKKTSIFKVIKKFATSHPLTDNSDIIDDYYSKDRGLAPVANRKTLLSNYKNSNLFSEADTFALYRIIGNDLYPRHRKGQSRENLRFILENESDFIGCEKHFIVNRIINPDEEKKILKLLKDSNASFIHIPFVSEEYNSLNWDIEGVPSQYSPCGKFFSKMIIQNKMQVLMRLYRHKNNYVMNNNGARNIALREGKKLAKWVLAWDGNCFLTKSAWAEIQSKVKKQPEIPYYIVPMARVIDNNKLLDENYKPTANAEPQIIFRRDTSLNFNPDYYYGRRPKVELLWRLGVPGMWDNWHILPSDLPFPEYAEQAGAFEYAGWVARLFSGQSQLEEEVCGENPVLRGLARAEGIEETLNSLDSLKIKFNNDIEVKSFTKSTDSNLMNHLKNSSDQALLRGPNSVIDKSIPTPQDPKEYWTPAPYWHPRKFFPCLPYVWKDGCRVPGTVLYEPQSDRYDRTRAQRLFDDTYILCLAYINFEDDRYIKHATNLVRRWFLQPESAMMPRLKYAQIRRGHNKNEGRAVGIIEFKDLYYFLDAIRLLIKLGTLTSKEQQDLKIWFEQYLLWLCESPQGLREKIQINNHGTYYDLQVASIAAFLEDDKIFRETLRNSRIRIFQQFTKEGVQHTEMKRSTTAHYCCFNLQGWINLAEIGSLYGEDLWSFEGSEKGSIKLGMEWLLGHIGRDWPYQQINDFDSDRFLPIYYAYEKQYGELKAVNKDIIPKKNKVKPLFHPHDGVTPYWQLKFS